MPRLTLPDSTTRSPSLKWRGLPKRYRRAISSDESMGNVCARCSSMVGENGSCTRPLPDSTGWLLSGAVIVALRSCEKDLKMQCTFSESRLIPGELAVHKHSAEFPEPERFRAW